MVNTELRILRVFGPTAAEVSAVLRQARADGCPGLRLLERDGEFAVCVQVSAPNRAMAEQYCEKWGVGPLYGSAAGNGAIVVTTKNGFVQKNKMNSNIQTIASVGYQQTVEFYSPAYDTKAKKESTTPDLRSTIYWNPSVQVDESGTAHVSFYTADSAADYGIVIEGVCASGNLIYSGEKIVSRHNASY